MAKRAKIISISAFCLAVIMIVAIASFTFGKNFSLQANTIQTAISQPETPNPTPSFIGIPIGKNTIAFATTENETYLRYVGKIFSQQGKGGTDAKEVAIDSVESLNWIGLISAPDNVDPIITPNTGIGNDIFGFKLLPDNKKFIFIMRFKLANKPDQIFHIYLFDEKNVSEISQFMLPSPDGKYSVPKLSQISSDGNFVSLNMFGCWNCGGHEPETLLLNLSTKATKRIGKVSYFAWKENGAYEYKDYKVIPCKQESIVECSDDPNNLPLKTDKF